MPWRLKYPEAPGKRDHYDNLVTTLTGSQNKIQTWINGARTVNASSTDPQNTDGEYSIRYKAKRDDWIDIHRQKIRIFDTFITDLGVCITNADTLRALWAGRIGITEYYE